MASKEPTIANKLVCPHCENDSEFFEVAEDALITTYYCQNDDGSFTATDQGTEIMGGMHLYCSNCGENLDQFLERFREMIF